MPSPLTVELQGLAVEPRYRTWFARGPWTQDLEHYATVQHILRDMEETVGADSRTVFLDDKGTWILVVPRDEAVQAFMRLCDADDQNELITGDDLIDEILRQLPLHWRELDIPSRIAMLAQTDLPIEMATFTLPPAAVWPHLAFLVLEKHWHPDADLLFDAVSMIVS